MQKQIDLKGEIEKSTIIVGDFNTSLSSIDRPNKQKNTKVIDSRNQQPTRPN